MLEVYQRIKSGHQLSQCKEWRESLCRITFIALSMENNTNRYKWSSGVTQILPRPFKSFLEQCSIVYCKLIYE